jgi:hypothetical protein
MAMVSTTQQQGTNKSPGLGVTASSQAGTASPPGAKSTAPGSNADKNATAQASAPASPPPPPVAKPFAKQLEEWNTALVAKAGRGLIELLREIAHDIWGDDVPPPSPVEPVEGETDAAASDDAAKPATGT